MKRLLLAPLILTILLPVQIEAHPISLEERAIDVLIAKYNKQLKKRLEGTGVNPAYMAWVDDECNVTIKAGIHQARTFSAMDWFNVDVCKGQAKLIDLTKRQ